MSTPNLIAPSENDNEIELLDLLIVIAENLKLLVLLPLAVGIIALGVSYAFPQTYESSSILRPAKLGIEMPGQVLVSYIKSADVLEAVADETQFHPDLSPENRIRAIEQQIRVSVGKQDQLVTLNTQAHSPEAARQLNQTIWQHVLRLTIPPPQQMGRLQEQLTSEQERLKSGEELEVSTRQILAKGAANESTARLYGELLTSNSERQRSIATLESQMEGLTLESLAQQPTLPEVAVKPKKSLITIAATLIAGFLSLLFVFGKYALQGANQNPARADKLQQLRHALGFKK